MSWTYHSETGWRVLVTDAGLSELAWVVQMLYLSESLTFVPVHAVPVFMFMYAHVCNHVGFVCARVCDFAHGTDTVTSLSVLLLIVQMVKLDAPTKQQTIYSNTNTSHLVASLVQSDNKHVEADTGIISILCSDHIILLLTFNFTLCHFAPKVLNWRLLIFSIFRNKHLNVTLHFPT